MNDNDNPYSNSQFNNASDDVYRSQSYCTVKRSGNSNEKYVLRTLIANHTRFKTSSSFCYHVPCSTDFAALAWWYSSSVSFNEHES
jgi:hypothetical protein